MHGVFFRKTAGEAEGSSTLRILVATDCHLGYLEKEELRRSDSFDTFEEIFSLAEKHNVNYYCLLIFLSLHVYIHKHVDDD